MQAGPIRRSIFAALLAAAGSLAVSCSLVEAQGSDLAATTAGTQLVERHRFKRRRIRDAATRR